MSRSFPSLKIVETTRMTSIGLLVLKAGGADATIED